MFYSNPETICIVFKSFNNLILRQVKYGLFKKYFAFFSTAMIISWKKAALSSYALLTSAGNAICKQQTFISIYAEHYLTICLLTSAGNAIFKQRTFISTYVEHYLIICLLTSAGNAIFKKQTFTFNNMLF